VAALNIHALGQASHLPNLLVTVFHHTPVETKKNETGISSGAIKSLQDHMIPIINRNLLITIASD
jgi:hypothetical protein